MFETSMQHKDEGAVWGVAAGIVAFVILLTAGWLLVA